MELTDHLSAIRKHWWITVLTLLATVGIAAYVSSRMTPVYESTVTFFVAASTDTGTALQADEFAQRRINSYVGVLSSELLAQEVAAQPDIDLTPAEVTSRVSALVDPETILLTATVTDTETDRALRIAEAIATEFGPLISRLDSTDAASGASVSLTVISGPTLNPEPISPRTTLNIGVAALAGIALGLALSIARQMLDRTVRSLDDLKRATGLPTLATIGAEGRRRRGGAGELLIVDAEPGSPRAEAYRQLRTNLTFSAVTKRMQVVVVTSAVPGDGKTTTACNLAITLAEAGRSVLLVEADMRRPMVAQRLGIEGSAGLTNVLAGAVKVDDVLQPWGQHGLQVLAAGTLPPNPSELLGSDAMRELVTELRGRFETIVVDTPPVLPVTDASVVATHADIVVLVVRYGGTTREQARAAVEGLAAVGAPLAGTILNGAPSAVTAGGYGASAYATTGRAPRAPGDAQDQEASPTTREQTPADGLPLAPGTPVWRPAPADEDPGAERRTAGEAAPERSVRADR
ncbi:MULTISPECIES: polysaccharide biosynthesis tyrosine autokinase [unclassified Actinotalea]|uniref:polysaccharide biosynthesis tyrosine autokinase n=1 Tax=unclassified Actinotalea TaxID=2638618 RepID=UPI0015F39A93|nr:MULTISPECIES: polysaccharide biosynthesis tyrosine autokinase [unclassified Actinotalea]